MRSPELGAVIVPETIALGIGEPLPAMSSVSELWVSSSRLSARSACAWYATGTCGTVVASLQRSAWTVPLMLLGPSQPIDPWIAGELGSVLYSPHGLANESATVS